MQFALFCRTASCLSICAHIFAFYRDIVNTFLLMTTKIKKTSLNKCSKLFLHIVYNILNISNEQALALGRRRLRRRLKKQERV